MINPVPESKTDIHSDEFLRLLMRRQLRISVICAATFLLALFGLPLANYFFPELMARRVFGFTVSWFITVISTGSAPIIFDKDCVSCS